MKKLIILIVCLFAGNALTAQTYCVPSYADTSGSFIMDRFYLTGYLGSYIADTMPTYDTYQDRTSLAPTVTLQAGGTYDGYIGVNIAYEFYESEIWIDLNNDGVFASSEAVSGVFPSYVTDYSDTFHFSLQVPATTPLSTYRMRVREAIEWDGTASLLMDPCASFDTSSGTTVSYLYGNTADYLVNIIPQLLPMPDTFFVSTASNCAEVNFTLSANDSSGPSLYTKNYFGDGTSDTNNLSMSYGHLRYTDFFHAYSSTGNFTVKHVLYNGALALDSTQYSNNVVFCNTIPLQFYVDNNANCIDDSGDIASSLPVSVEIDSNGVPIDTICATSGLYFTAYGSPGDVYAFRITPSSAAFNIVCPSSGVLYDTLTEAFSPATRYIALRCSDSASFDLSVNAIVPVTGVEDEWGNAYVQNLYCEPVDATLKVSFSPKYAGEPGSFGGSVAGNTITWHLGSVASSLTETIDQYYQFWAGSEHLTIGDTVISTYTISPTIGDADTSNNQTVIIDTVRGGCDPNEMWVSPSCIASGDSATQLKYTLNFENTGNDTAFNIYVLDTLSPDVDPSSMKIVMSSKEMYTSRYKDAAGHTIIKFDFPHINLLDSSHHGQCDGDVIFTINTKPGLPTGAHIYNRAGVYFDINPVVMTNQVDDEIGCPTAGVNQAKATRQPTVYPNPATDVLIIRADEQQYSNYTITNEVGETVLNGPITQQHTQVDVKALPAGIYFVNIQGTQATEVVKFAKW